jgi:hypothetical protein
MDATRRMFPNRRPPRRDRGRDAVRRSVILSLSLLGSLGFAAGCVTPEKVTVTTTGVPDYQRMHVVYDVNSDSGRLDQPPVCQVSQADEATPNPPSTRVRLELEYPYPGLHPAFARATLRVLDGSNPPQTTAAKDNSKASAKKSKESSSAHFEEALVIDLPKTELDSLLKDLAGDGFFKKQDIASGTSNLTVTYNRATVEKGWNHEARLDDLIKMLEAHGSPVAVTTPGKRS